MKKTTSWITVLLLATSLQACSTPYQKLGFHGGYSETKLDRNIFKVSFQGNKKTDREKTWDFALLRSAELTLESGYRYFTVMDSNYYENLGILDLDGSSIVTVAPSSTNLIACFHEEPENVLSYDARFIYRELTSKYEIEPALDKL